MSVRIRAGSVEVCTAAVIFDKDGVLFDHPSLMAALHAQRRRQVRRSWGEPAARRYDRLAGVSSGTIHPEGPLALATVDQELTLLAAAAWEAGAGSWLTCLDWAREAMARADQALDLGQIRPLPGCPEVVVRLRRQEVPLGLITSDLRHRTLWQLAAVRLEAAFQVIVAGDDPGPSKPDPAALSAVVTALGVAPAQAVMVGDSANDWAMAQGAGVRCISVGRMPPERFGVIASVPDLAHLDLVI